MNQDGVGGGADPEHEIDRAVVTGVGFDAASGSLWRDQRDAGFDDGTSV